jgi:acyl-CoA dehydrogenase
MPDAILHDSAMRLFGDLADSEGLWAAVEAAGYLDVLAEGPAGMVEAATIVAAAGHHAAAIPLPETMLARWLCAACGIAAPAGRLTLGPVEPDDRLALAVGAISGHAGRVPWGREAAALVLVAGASLLVVDGAAASFAAGANLAGEPRDDLVAVAAGGRSASLPNSVNPAVVLRLGALCRAAQMAGAMAAVLAVSTRYANDRVQFGRPIAKFQAIQQQLAVLAEHAAAAQVAVENAARAVAENRASAAFAVAAAKIRAGDAAGKVAEIAHQVHGAIGFTHEHSLHRLTRRLWSWRDEFGDESHWSQEIGRQIMTAGADALWPTLTAP